MVLKAVWMYVRFESSCIELDRLRLQCSLLGLMTVSCNSPLILMGFILIDLLWSSARDYWYSNARQSSDFA
jgi:hypothetical protein